MTEPAWISRPGWGLAHLLLADSEHEWLGAQYAKTMCGRRVRADAIAAEPYADRCKTCLRGRPADPTGDLDA